MFGDLLQKGLDYVDRKTAEQFKKAIAESRTVSSVAAALHAEGEKTVENAIGSLQRYLERNSDPELEKLLNMIGG